MPWVLALATLGLGIYGAVSAADARSQQENFQKARLANEGILTAEEKKLKEAQINAIETQIQQANPQTISQPTVAPAGAGPPGLDNLFVYGVGALLLWIGVKAVNK